MNILAIQVHTPFFYTLAKTLGHEWYFIASSYTLPWGPERPLPKNCHVLTKKEAREYLRKGKIDLYIISTEEQFLFNREDVPTLFIEHNPTIGRKPHYMDDSSVSVMWPRQSDATWSKEKKVNYHIYPDLTLFNPLKYNGRDRKVIQVCKGFGTRPEASGIETWHKVTREFPREVAGRYNEDIEEGIGYLDYNQIRRYYANSRVYFDTKIFWHSTSVQEALYTGMPIVTVDTKAPFRDSEMIKSRDPEYLRKSLEELLDNLEYSKELGAKGKKAYLKSFPLEEWKRAWGLGFQKALELYDERKKHLEKFASLDSLLERELKDILLK